MIAGFRCDNCFDFVEQAEEMKKHESECEYNDANRSCLTCEYAECDINDDMHCDLNVVKQTRIHRDCSRWTGLIA